ncbi:MAG: ABC transporter substrate-binding protein [Rickettsiales bacterium]
MSPSVSKRNFFSYILSLFATAVILGLPAQSAASAEDQTGQPALFIQGLADEAISVLRDQGGSLDEREKKFRAVLGDDFAMEKIGRFAAGKFWREMSDEQKTQYQTLFEEWILKTYSIHFGSYAGETVNVQKTIKAGQSDVFVRTQITNSNGRALKVDWRVRRIDDRLKIIDVVVEGVSMLVTQKAEFNAVLRQRGVDGLINILRTQLDRMAAAKAS